MTAETQIPIASSAVTVIVLRTRGETVETLLLLRADSRLGDNWFQVTGRLEAAETGWQAALRELWEETGLTPERFYAGNICDQFYEPRRDSISIIPLFVAVIPADAAVRLNHEHTAYRWVTVDEAIDTVRFPGQRRLFAHVQAEFVARTPSEALRIDMI